MPKYNIVNVLKNNTNKTQNCIKAIKMNANLLGLFPNRDQQLILS